jgi:hypothetical protein
LEFLIDVVKNGVIWYKLGGGVPVYNTKGNYLRINPNRTFNNSKNPSA